jgi:adenylate cyclase
VAEERVQRRLAAIISADVVGYSRLMGADEEGTLTRLNALREELLHPKVAEYGGRIVKTTGDGTLIEFASAVDAVQHAVDVQLALSHRNADLPENERIEIRMGINLGDIIVQGEDIYGDGVNVAARLEALSEPGGVYISDLVQASIRNKLDIALDDLGEQSLKNIVEPVRVYRVVLDAGPSSSDATATDALFRRPAVAVLPFENLSGDPEQEYFADGLTEDIITALSLWRSFPVIARNSTFAYKGQSPDIRKVGAELGARYVIEGSVRKAGKRVRVTAQLINSETRHHVWAERYDRELEDIFDLQDEITRQIATIIEPAIERTEHQRITTKPPARLAAWEFCVRGFVLEREITRDANVKARELFQQAIELDPNYARAYTGLASTYALDLRFYGTDDRNEWVRRMMECAQKGVALDETDPSARIVLARANIHMGLHDAAIADARKAIQLNPYSAEAYRMLASVLSTTLARYEEGISWLERALQLNPSDPQHQITAFHMAVAHLGAGRYEEAVLHARDSVRRQPDYPDGTIALASALGYLDRAEEAVETMKGHKVSIPSYVQQHPIYGPEVKKCLLDGLRKAGLLT